MATRASEDATRTVWFHRDYERFTGGHLKHAHYFEHVRRAAGFAPAMSFGGEPESPTLLAERDRLWPVADCLAPSWSPGERDVLFVAGTDWRYVDANGLGGLPNPRINLIQHVRHAHSGTELHSYLDRRAIRICVSQEVADAIGATGRVNGPILTIPNGVDLTPAASAPSASGARRHPVLIAAYKRPDVGQALAERLDQQGVAHKLVLDFMDRDAFLTLLRASDVAVCLPRAEEGFYLPALEAMAAGCTVVTMDCIGNRGFCRHDGNCLVGHDAASLAACVQRVRSMAAADRDRLGQSALRTVRDHALSRERQRFHAILDDVDRLWQGERARPTPANGVAAPVVDFMIVGAQKCGTTALAHFLDQHPAIGMSAQKEVHLFDSPEYSPDWSPAEIDRRYVRHFQNSRTAKVRGEATPIYMYLPDVAAELKRYNPALKLIVMLRDPAERAISEYRMQRNRGRERRSLWLALLAEPFRLRRDRRPREQRSATREHGYRSRGLYSRQLRRLDRHFPKAQVHLVRSEDLRRRHNAVLRDVLTFLGVDADVRIPAATVFPTDGEDRHPIIAAVLRLTYLAEFVRLRRLNVRL